MSTSPVNLLINGPTYLEARRGKPRSASVVLFGVPYDGTACFRPGARFGPDALRVSSDGLESYSPRLDRDLVDIDLVDVGNLDVGPGAPEPVLEAVGQMTGSLLDAGAVPIMLGGDHSFTVAAVRAAAERHPNLALVQIDAHADLRDGYTGGPFSHASAIRRCLDFLESDAVLQVGIRSGTREEFDEMRSADRLVAPTGAALRTALSRLGDRPLYVTIDLDVFDPSVLPGTGTPEPGGISWATFEQLVDALAAHCAEAQTSIVACDAVELAPHYDASGVSAVVAAKVVRQMSLLVG